MDMFVVIAVLTHITDSLFRKIDAADWYSMYTM